MNIGQRKMAVSHVLRHVSRVFGVLTAQIASILSVQAVHHGRDVPPVNKTPISSVLNPIRTGYVMKTTSTIPL